MPRPHFDAELIGELRTRVVEHNRSAPAGLAKLAEVKRIYTNAFKGPEPGERALRKVDGYLADLAKAKPFDDSKHPRGKKGEFASEGGARIELPTTEDGHRELQQTNAGYRALTSELLPTQRNESLGRLLTTAVSVGGGAAIVGSILRGRPNGLVRRAARAAAGTAGSALFGVPAAFAGHGATAGIDAAKKIIARAAGRSAPSPATYETATRFAAGAADVGSKIARGITGAAVGGASKAVQGVMHVAGSGEASSAVRRARQVGAFAALAAAPAFTIKAGIEASPLDPASAGRNLDAFSYRQIEKAVMSGEAEALRKNMVDAMRGGAGVDDLAKLRLPFVGAVRGAVRAGLGALGGAAAGAAVGAGVHAATSGQRGNPHHDAHGRFTSGGSSVLGAIAGGAAAGLGVYAAIKSHNTKQLSAVFQRQTGRLGRLLERVSSPNGHGHVAKMIANRDSTARTLLGGDLPFAKKARTDLAELAAQDSHPGHYKEFIRAKTNDVLADHLHQIDEFAIPDGKSGNPVSMLDLRAKGRTLLDPSGRAKQEVLDFVKTAKPSEFAKAVKSIKDPEQAKRATDLYESRQKWINGVDDQVAGRQAKLSELHEAREKAQQGEKDAEDAFDAAQHEVDNAEPGTKRAATAALKRATSAYDKAGKIHRDAKDAVDAHEKMATGVMLPKDLGGGEIPKPTAQMQRATRDAIQEQAHRDALAHVDKGIAKARTAQKTDILHRHARVLAAHTYLAMKAGGSVPKEALAEAVATSSSHSAHLAAKANVVAAERNLIESQARHDALVVSKPTDPSGHPAHAAAVSAMKATVKANEDSLKMAHAGVKSAAANVIGASEALNRRLLSVGTPSGPRLPSVIVRDLKREVMHGVSVVRSPVDRFLASPSAKGLHDLAATTMDTLKSSYNAAKEGVGGALDHTFREDAKDGKRILSVPKIAAVASASTAIATAVSEHGKNIRHALFGDEKEKAEARPFSTPKGFQISQKRDPLDGSGHFAITVPDAKTNDQTVLYGHHYSGPNSTQRLRVGSTLSDVHRLVAETRQRHQQHNQNRTQAQGSGTGPARQTSDVANIDPSAKATIDASLSALGPNGLETMEAGGATAQFRANADTANEAGATAFMNHLHGKFMNHGSPTGGLQHHALDALFSKQGGALKRKQAYRELTGYAIGGQESKHHPIFARDARFASQDSAEVANALHATIDKTMASNPPTDDRQRGALHLAAGVIGKEKGISADAMTAIHAKIRATNQHQSSNTGPAAETPKPDEPASDPFANPALSNSLPAHFSESRLATAVEDRTERLSSALKIKSGETRDLIGQAVKGMANIVGHTHGLDEERSAKVAHDAILDAAGGDAPNKAAVYGTLKNMDFSGFSRKLRHHADLEQGLDKAMLLDDFDALVKEFEFDPDLHPRIGRGAGGGEFAPKGGGHGEERPDIKAGVRQAATDAPIDYADKSVNAGLRATPGKPSSWYNLGRLVPDAASELGASVGFKSAEHIAANFLPAPLRAAAEVASAPGIFSAAKAAVGLGAVGATKEAGKAALKFGIGAAGSTVSGVAAGAAGAAATKGIKSVTPGYRDSGEQTAETIGSAAGSLLGILPSAPTGFLAGAATSAAGSYLGGKIARGVYDWFNGYDAPAVKRISAKYMTAK